MSVGTWNPAEQVTELGASVLGRLISAAGQPSESDFGLTPSDIERLAGVAHSNRVDWQSAADGLSDDELISLVHLYTLAEARFPAWKSGAHSPVIVMAKTLRGRGAWPDELTAWIRNNSQNRFLPYGSLLDRV